MARENLSDPAREGLRRYLDGKGITMGVGIVVTADEEIVHLRSVNAELLDAIEMLLAIGDFPMAFDKEVREIHGLVMRQKDARTIFDYPQP